MSDYVVRFGDAVSGIIRGDLRCASITWARIFNAPGSASLVCAASALSRSGATSDVIAPNSSFIMIERDGFFVWTGVVRVITASPDGSVKFDCEGWHVLARACTILSTQIFAQVNQMQIMLNLAATWTQQYRQNTVSVSPRWINLSANYSYAGTPLRDRTYDVIDYNTVGDAMEKLAACLNGMQFDYIAEWSNGLPSVRFHIEELARISDLNYVLDTATNLQGGALEVDGTQQNTRVVDVGAVSNDPTLVWNAEQPLSLMGIVPEQTVVLSDPDVRLGQTLRDKATGRLNAAFNPILRPTGIFRPNAELGWDDLIMGAGIRVRGNFGSWFVLDDVYSIVELSGKVDRTGEDLKVGLASGFGG